MQFILALVGALAGTPSGFVQGPQEAPAQESPRPQALPAPVTPQTLSFSYRYHLSYPEYLDRENVAGGGMGVMDAIHFALREGPEDPLALRLVKWGVAALLDEAVLFVSHEYGHISSFTRAGFRGAVFGDAEDPSSEWEGASPGSIFLTAFDGTHTGVSLSDSDWQEVRQMFAAEPEKLSRFLISMEAGGLNQEQVVLSRYAGRLRDGRFSFLDTLPYFLAATGTVRYPLSSHESDLTDYVARLEERGIETSGGRVKLLSGLRLLSGTAVAAARGTWHGLAGRRGDAVEPLELRLGEGARLSWPEFEAFLTEFGPTVKASVPLGVGDWRLAPSYEHLWAGNVSMAEWGFRASAPVSAAVALHAALFRHSEGGSWLEGSLEVRPMSWLGLIVGYSRGRGYSFHRDIYGAVSELLEDRESGVTLGVSVSQRF